MRSLSALSAFAFLLLAAAGAGETPSASTSAPQPYARVRVSIPSIGGRAEIREPSTADPYGQTSVLSSTPGVDIPPLEDTAETGTETDGQPLVLATLHGNDITEEDVVRELLERRGRETLEWLIGRDILQWELDRLELEITDAEIDERLEKHIEGFRKAFPGFSRPDDLTRAAAGMRLDEYRERSVWAELALRKIMRVSLKPANEQLRGYYAERQAEFIRPERVKISQVFIAPQPDAENEGMPGPDDWALAEKQILEAHTRLRMGEEFVDVARAYGSGGQIARWAGRGELLRELEEAAFGIGVGSTTAPIKTSMGYHILLVEEKAQRKVPAYEEVRDEVAARFEERQFVLLAGEFMSRLRDKALRSGGLVIAPEAGDFPAADRPTARKEE